MSASGPAVKRKPWYKRPRFIEWGSPAPSIAIALAAVSVALLLDGQYSSAWVTGGFALGLYALYRLAEGRGDDDRHGFF